MLTRRRLPEVLLPVLLLIAALALPRSSASDAARSGVAPPAEGLSGRGAFPGASLAEEPAAPEGVRLLSSGRAGVTFAIDVPWQRLAVEPAGTEGYVRVSLPGWDAAARPGAPELPYRAAVVGVPEGAELSILVKPGPAHRLALAAPVVPVAAETIARGAASGAVPVPGKPRPLPVPTLALNQDPAVYGASSPYPRALAEIASDAIVRRQRVAAVAVYPVQYDPGKRELIAYESLTVHVAFSGGQAASALSAPDSPAYESLFRSSLLNYEAARAWRLAVPSSAFGRGEGGEGAAWSPPLPGWRVTVREEGFYRLTYGDLQAAGLPVDTLDPQTLRLYSLGIEAAIQVEGEADGRFDAQDGLVFFGRAASSKYTADNIYWLTFGQGPGLRMAARDGTPGGAGTPAYHVARLHMEDNHYYIPESPGDESLDHYIWDYLYAPYYPSWTHTFALAAPYSGEHTATLTLALLGDLEDPVSPDHHAQIYLNDTLVGDEWWDGITWRVVEIAVPQGLLLAGDNTLSVVCPNDTGVGADIVMVDWARLEFADTFQAASDELHFNYAESGVWQFEAGGFGSDQVSAYDVTDAYAVARIEGVQVSPSGGGYSALFQDTVAAPASYWLLAGTAYRSAAGIVQDTPSDLQSPDNGADYLVITHPSFWEQAGALVTYRSSQGLRTALVDVQDVYDEFGHGLAGAAPIRDFLAYAYAHWQAPAPSYVVLVGDGSYDPKDYEGFGQPSYIPPYLSPADPWLGETAADNRYAAVDGGDTFPDVMLGRLSVTSPAEAAVLVQKIVDYEQSPAPGNWNRQVLAVADNADSAGDFAAMSDALLSGYLPQPYQPQKVYYGVTHPTPAQARAAIVNGINAGRLIVNYLGHAAASQWTTEGVWSGSDIAQLDNAGMLPVVLPMTCMDGYYVYPFPSSPDDDALAETFTRADGGGAVASWSPTGLGVSTGHAALDQGFFEAVFLDGMRGLGQATTAGKLKLWATGSNLDLLDTYLLFGDPATEINALDADLQVAKSASPAGPVTPGTVLNYTLTYTNNGPAAAHHVVLSDPVPSQLLNPQVVQASPGAVLRPGTAFVWDIEALAPGETGTIKLRARVSTTLPPPYTIANTAQIEGAEPDPVPGNDSASAGTDVVGKMHLGAIAMSYTVVSPRYRVAANAKVLDAAGRPVASATASMRWTLPNGSTVDQQALSRDNGAVTFRVTSAQVGAYQVCVTGIAKEGYLYDPGANVEPCDTLTVP